ncbi:MAG: arginase [Acidobacteria bacterium]|nr:arginase [Acidobacteriota bacterium]
MTTNLRRTVHVHGVPLDLGSGRRGVDMGPSAVRIAGLGDRLAALGFVVQDHGDLLTPIPETQAEEDPRKKYVHQIAAVCRDLYRAVQRSHEAGALPIVIGGDHSLAAGSVAASADAHAGPASSIGVLWIDAHGDMNTPATTLSGNVHGMPLAALVGGEPAELSGIGRRSPAVSPDRVAIVGLRNLDEQEKQRIRDSGIHVFTMKDIDRHGIASVMERAIDLTSAGGAGLHVSLDLDVCDPTIAPGVGTPVKGGLSYREAHLALEMVADAGLLLALDIVEINPILDVRNQTAILGTELALSALGAKIL